MKTNYRKLLALNLVLLLALTVFALPALAAYTYVDSWYFSYPDFNTFTVKQSGEYSFSVSSYSTMTPLSISLYDNMGNRLGSDDFSCHLTANVEYQLRGYVGSMGGGSVNLYLVKADSDSASNLAYASTQDVLVDGKSVEFQCYALKDEAGNDTNYIKLRDVAQILNGTAVQFEVGWDGEAQAINIETGKAYTSNGSEMSTPFSGNRAYEDATATTNVNGTPVSLSAILLKDDSDTGYTYYKLRDLGDALGFKVDWSEEKGIFIETK